METHGMHPDSHPLESSYEPTGDRAAAGQDDSMIQDFNSFFEKLSSLDHLQWSADPQPTTAPAQPPAGATPRRKSAAGIRPAKPRMTVVKSDVDLDDPPPVDMSAPEMHGRATMRDVARFLKTTLVGLVLFAMGLGAGWAALSLPGRFDQGMPSLSHLMERMRTITVSRFGAEAGQPGGLHGVQGSQASPGAAPAASTGSAAKADATAAATADADAIKRAQETAEHLDPDAGIQLPKLGNTVTVASHAKPKAAAHGASRAKAPQPATAAAHAATQAGAAQDGSATPAAATASASGPQFTLQVGACSSYRCVEAYKRLLAPAVNPRSIKVVTEGNAQGGQSIQRIRIQPLQRTEAERLKARLAASDARFKGAYLIALH